jgi:hypothetical protein
MKRIDRRRFTEPGEERGREVGEEPPFQGGLDECGFMRRSASHVHGERNTIAIAYRHDFAALTASSRADGGACFRRTEGRIDDRVQPITQLKAFMR